MKKKNLKDKLRALAFNGDIENIWNSLKSYTLEVANASGKRKISGMGKRIDWWTEDLQ